MKTKIAKNDKAQNLSEKPYFELLYSQEELDDIDLQLSAEEEETFKEILELEKQNDGKTDFIELEKSSRYKQL